jgi:hypothetical protein
MKTLTKLIYKKLEHTKRFNLSLFKDFTWQEFNANDMN